jgi:HD-like signal output (HDOD) protein
MTSAPASDPSTVEKLLGKTIGDIGIPPCPAILNQINEEMRKDDPDPRHLDTIISSDVGLAAGLIALANSPFFGFRNRVRSVKEALQMLGLNIASRAIAGLILRKVFPPSPVMERFWDASARISRLSGWLTQEQRIGHKLSSDEAYTFGLFRDCGIPVLLKRFPNYPEALKQANADTSRSFTEIETEHCAANHAAVGCLLAQAWWLPDDICLAIHHHHDHHLLANCTGKPSKMLLLVAVAQLAEHLLQKHSNLSQTQEWQKGGEACLALLDISEAQLETIYTDSAAIATGEG